MIVVDTNIIISALIAHGGTLKLLRRPALDLYAPDFVLDELENLNGHIREKTGLDDYEYNLLIVKSLEEITIVPLAEWKDLRSKARAISPDPNDWPFFALALKLQCPIWSNDKLLKRQGRIKVLTTDELILLVSKKF